MNNTSYSGLLQDIQPYELHSFINFRSQVPFISYVFLFIVAIAGNSMVVLSFLLNRSLQTIFNSLLFNLAIVDLFTGIFRIGFVTLSLATIGNGSWPYGTPLCNLNGFFHSVSFSANVYTLMMIALFRYVVVVHWRNDLITRKTALFIIIFIWIYSVALGLLPLLGWNRYRYQPHEYTCLPDWYHEENYSILISVTDVYIPMVVLCYCYLAIYIFIRKNTQRIRAFSTHGNNEAAMEHITRRETKVTQAMFSIFLTFIACVAPYTICMFILTSIFHVTISPELIFICGYLVNLNSAINPIIYAIFYKNFRTAYYRLCCLNRSRVGISQHNGSPRTFKNPKLATTITNYTTNRLTTRSKTTETLLPISLLKFRINTTNNSGTGCLVELT